MSGTIISNPNHVKVYSFDRKSYQNLRGSFIYMHTHPMTKSNSTPSARISVWAYIDSLTTAERWLFMQILDKRNYKNNIANVLGTTVTEKDYIKKGYKKLFEDGWVARIKRAFYMLNPVVIETDTSLMVDTILLWNAHCHNDAVIEMPQNYQLTTFDMDTSHILDLIKQAKFTTLADAELLSIIAYMRTANWLDNNDSLTARTPSTATHAQHIVDECKTRGLI